jgi:radical SAM protein with 4Fe4S-binding SPASM domain
MKNVGEILPDKPFTQVFCADADHLCGVSLLVATYGPERKTSNLTVQLHLMDNGLRRVAVDHFSMEKIYDNSYIELLFEPQADSKGKHYHLRVQSIDSSMGNAATLYLTDQAERIAGHVWCSDDQTGDAYGIIAKLAYAQPLAETLLPPSLEISTVSQCNLNCVHCISRGTRTTANRLSEELRRMVTRWAREGALKSAYTDFSGDLLWADRKFGSELEFFIGLSIPFHIDTNATCVDLAVADRLFASKITSINVSIDAAQDITYRRIRRGAPSLESIKANMRLLVDRRAVWNRSDVQLSAAFVMMRSNLEELPDFVHLVHGVGFDAVRTIHLQSYTEEMDAESLWWDKERFNQVREKVIEQAAALGITLFIERAFENRAVQVATSFCSLPWEAAYLLANGDVLACCVPGMHMGNLHQESMEDIWNGPKYQKLRRTVNSIQRPASCVACPFNRKANNPLSYMPHRAIAAGSRPKVG